MGEETYGRSGSVDQRRAASRLNRVDATVHRGLRDVGTQLLEVLPQIHLRHLSERESTNPTPSLSSKVGMSSSGQ